MSGSPTGTAAAARTWAGVNTRVPETDTRSTRVHAEPYRSQSEPPARSSRASARMTIVRRRGGLSLRTRGGPDDSCWRSPRSAVVGPATLSSPFGHMVLTARGDRLVHHADEQVVGVPAAELRGGAGHLVQPVRIGQHG